MSESDAVRSELESPPCTRAKGRNTAEEKEAHATEGPRAVTGPRVQPRDTDPDYKLGVKRLSWE